jgi:hypothetical protein
MAGPKNTRKSRSGRINIVEYNSNKKTRNLLHEIVTAEAKYLKLLDRHKRGLSRTPGHRKAWDDAHKEIVKSTEVARLQGFAEGSKRAEKLLAHVASLKSMLG